MAMLTAARLSCWGWISVEFEGLTCPQGNSQLSPEGSGEQVVNVNNLLVPENTQLKNGDFVIRSRELLKI